MRSFRHALPYIATTVIGAMIGSATAIAALKGSVVFPDVPAGSYFDEAVGEMYDIGVIKGYENGRFGPNDTVTRGQVAVMMQRLRADMLGEDLVDEDEDEASSSSASSEAVSTNAAGDVHFATATFTVNESAGTATISLIRSGGTTGATAVKYKTTNGTGMEGQDYYEATGTVSFANGESSKTFTVEILSDSIDEPDETINIELSEATGGMTLGTPKTSVLTITDDDAATSSANGIFKFSAAEYAIAENGSSVTITVERTTGSQGAVAVSYATSNGTAGSEHYTTTNGTLSFAAGETSKSFGVVVTDNATVGGNKTINLTLSSPTGGAILSSTPTALLTIIDNEIATSGTGSFMFSRNSYEVAETEGQAVITVRRTGGTYGAASVSYATTNGTATAAADYTNTTGTLTFATGESGKTFIIPILQDTNSENSETVNLSISNPTNGATLASPSTATLTIE